MDDLAHLLAAQDWDKAEKLLRRAARDKSAPAPVFYNLAKVLEAAGKPAQRSIWLKRAVARDPSYAIAWFELGRATQDDGDLSAALSHFARAAALAPGDSDARLAAARLALRLGMWAEALTHAHDLGGDEAALLRYRAKAELGQATVGDVSAILSPLAARPAALTALTRVAKGYLPLRP